jgi:hypothetical protein
MKFISHRGNISGRDIENENLPSRIEECLSLGFDVEIDVWRVNGVFLLGHDAPEHRVPVSFLQRERIWCHAKNIEALSVLVSDPKVHCFWHQEDDYTITSRGFVWVYPGKNLSDGSVCVMPERSDYSYEQLRSCAGICSDNIMEYKSLLKKQRS